MSRNYEEEVKKLYPGAKPYMGVVGWGIKAPGLILALAQFKSVSAAWKRAWENRNNDAR